MVLKLFIRSLDHENSRTGPKFIVCFCCPFASVKLLMYCVTSIKQRIKTVMELFLQYTFIIIEFSFNEI